VKLLSIATNDRRPGICAACGQAVEYARFEARGAPGPGGCRVRGSYWAAAPHDCKRVVAVEPATGERGA